MSEFNHPVWGRQFESFATEFSRLCIACDIDILQPGIGERVLNNDESICGRRNQAAFKKLRRSFMAFYELEGKAIGRLGPEEVQLMLDQVRVEIAKLRGVVLEDSAPSESPIDKTEGDD